MKLQQVRSITIGVMLVLSLSMARAQIFWVDDSRNPLLTDGVRVLDPTVMYDPAKEHYDMWYSDGNVVKRAVSTDGISWQPTGVWQDLDTLFSVSSCYSVEVVKIDSTYFLYAGCRTYSGDMNIGLATSPNGNVWTKHSSSPVITPDGPTSWEKSYTLYPKITFRDGVYFMYYQGNGSELEVGLATSADGITWQKYAGNPVIGLDDVSGTITDLAPAGVTVVDGVFYMIVNEEQNANRVNGYLATSTDGITWTFQGTNPVIPMGNTGTWNSGWIGDGSLRYLQGQFWYWYCATDTKPYQGDQTWRMGLATSVTPQSISVSLPEAVGGAGGTLLIPLGITNVSGWGILSCEFTMTFNSPDSILRFDPTAVTTGTLSGTNGWTVEINTTVPNQVTVAAAGITPLSGQGTFLILVAHVHPSALAGDSSKLELTHFLFNAGSPTPAIRNGSVAVYERVCGDADENGLLQAYDAALTLREALGPMSPPPGPLTAIGRLNADVNMNGKVEAYDAALILRHVVGLAMPESTANCFDTGRVTGVPQTLALTAKLDHADYTGQYEVQVHLAGVPANMLVLSYAFEITCPAYGSDNISLTLPLLSEGYLATVNSLGNGQFKVGIINPNGVDVEKIPLTLTSNFASSLNALTFSDIYLNDAPNADVSLLNIFTSVETPKAAQPQSYDLIGAYPNPFNPLTRIAFQTPVNAQVSIQLFSAQGSLVKVICDEQMASGHHEVFWDGTNNLGQTVASGEYFCVMHAGPFMKTIRLLLLR
jgi:predicted GH43/DUF377 family glycosyl hydrolase